MLTQNDPPGERPEKERFAAPTSRRYLAYKARKRRLDRRVTWTPAALFAAGEDGLWGEPEPVYLYEDSAGTIADVVNNDPVGLMLDRSKGLELGPELVTNGTFDTDISGWSVNNNAELSFQAGRLRVERATNDKFPNASQTISGLDSNKTYLASGYVYFENAPPDSGGINIAGTGTFTSTGFSGYMETYVRGGTQYVFQAGFNDFAGEIGDYIEFDNLSLRELPGNHATQSTSADRLRYSSTPPNLVPDDVADQLNVTLPAIAAATVAIATPSGADIQYPVDLSSGSYVIDYQNSGVIILDREFTADETQKVTDYLNARAGV